MKLARSRSFVLAFLDVAFLILHTSIVLFVLSGWMFERTRKLHLVVTSLMMISWFGLGIVYGFGYCPCTDWHWQVKRALGETQLPISYVKYYADRLTGMDWAPTVIDTVTGVLGVGAFIISAVVNARRKLTSGDESP